MKITKTILLVFLCVYFMPNHSYGQIKDITEDPKYLKLVDFAQCNLKVTEIETVKSITLNDGKTLSPSRRDAKLVLVKLEGIAPDFGRISYNPSLFGVNYIFRGSLSFSFAKAIGWRGVTLDGEVTDIWHYKAESAFNIVIESAGDEVSIRVALEMPASLKTFYLRIPTMIQNPIEIAQ